MKPPKLTNNVITRKTPAAPAVYRPQPVPIVLQKKSSPVQNQMRANIGSALQPKKPPVAPPVYKPQPTPKVLQTKKAVFNSVQAKSSTPANNARVVQRHVDVNGVSDFNTLWANVRDRVERTWGRKKKLHQWVNDATPRGIPSYDDLADSLDKEFKARIGKARVRPNFTPKIISYFDETWGGRRHRRHVVMSSVMRDAVYSVTDKNEASDPQALLDLYKSLVAQAEFPRVPATLQEAETALVTVLHNNPANLVLDIGNWNSAIGALANNVRKELRSPNFSEVFEEFSVDSESFLDDLVGGFQPDRQREVMDFWKTYAMKNPITTEAGLRDFLEQIYDNAATDILSNKKLPPTGAALINCHVPFEQATSTGDPNVLERVCREFIGLGKISPLKYADVW